MYKYQVEVTEHIPDKLVKTFSKKKRKKLLDTGDGYSLNTIIFGRYEEFGPALLVADLLDVLWERACRLSYKVAVVEVEETADHILYQPRDYRVNEGNLESVKAQYAGPHH